MKKIITILTILVLAGITVLAEIPERPVPPRLVNDLANVLNIEEVNRLESSLVKFARETSTQIVVVTVADLEGYEEWDYAVRLGDKWGVGQKGKDNGIIVLLKPKTQDSRGRIYVATGYGLEAILPDAVINRTVVDYEMLPRFRENDYYGGLDNGIKVIMDITRGEYTAEHYEESVRGGDGGSIIFFIVVMVVIISLLGRNRRGRIYSPGRSLPFWLAMGMMSGRRSHGGSFGNFTSGGGSFGGFGGFGGGSFGGGGAGGSW